MTAEEKACVVAIEVDGRQKYLFETDKLQEMLGASRIIHQTVEEAKKRFNQNDGLYLFSPVSGEIRAWAPISQRKRNELLSAAWKLRCWLNEQGVEHTAAYFETDAAHFLGNGSSSTPNSQRPDPEKEPGRPDLAWVHQSVGTRIRRRKDAKSGADARPTCSLFAPCSIHGLDPANVWRPNTDPNRESRREQVGVRAVKKRETWNHVKEKFYDEHLREPVWEHVRTLCGDGKKVDLKRPITFSDLADKDDLALIEDQYIAFICADGDDLGRLLSDLDWNASAWGEDNKKPWERNAAFSRELDDCTRNAFTEAVVEVVVRRMLPDEASARAFLDQEKPKLDLPLLPQLLGGDDLWTVAGREVALDLCCTFAEKFAEKFEERVGKSKVMSQALQVAEQLRAQKEASSDPATKDEAIKPTMSLGVAFAKSGYPAHAMAEAAESLLKSAKDLRKGKVWKRVGEGTGLGCVDWHWIESSLSEPVKEARKKGWMYRSEDAVPEQGRGEVMLLTSRPWSVPQCRGFLKAARELTAIPRRKQQQLESILRLGYTLSLLAWESWWKGLKEDERKAVRTVNGALPVEWKLPDAGNPGQFEFFPWRKLGQEEGKTYYATPLLDLLALQDVLGERKETSASEEQPETEREEAHAAN